MALAPRHPRSWVTKREGRREESVSWIAGSYPIVVFEKKKKKAGVSSETPGYPCERAKHTHSPSAMVAKTHTTQGHWGRGGGGATAKLEMIDFFKGNGSRW